MVKDLKGLDNPALSYMSGAKETIRKLRSKKLPRLNVAFEEADLVYLRLAARVEGISITAYVNKLVKQDQQSCTEEKIELMSKLK